MAGCKKISRLEVEPAFARTEPAQSEASQILEDGKRDCMDAEHGERQGRDNKE